MINPTLHRTSSDSSSADFWQRLISDRALENCEPLEKLVAGCEVIAALDDLGLLAA